METEINYYIIKTECELDIDVYLLNSHIFTTDDLTVFSNSHDREAKGKCLVIGIEQKIADHESLFDIIPHIRPRFLIILGILSFFTQELFTPFDVSSSLTKSSESQERESKHFVFNNKNLLPEINLLIEFLHQAGREKTTLFYSLLDRWRKAFYLELESAETGVHDDEVLLSYFHILELLATYQYYEDQKVEIKSKIGTFTKDILRESLFVDGNNLQSVFPNKRKLLEEILLSDLPLGSKISFMLNKQGLLTDRLQYFISTLIKNRNDVAHGRQVYQEKVIFPVPPFFPLIKNRFYSFEDLRILTGRVIAISIGINHLETEWAEIESRLLPSKESVKDFLRNKSYKKLSNEEYFLGTCDGITPHVISHYLLINKIEKEDVLEAFSELILTYEFSDDNVFEILASVIIILDIAKDEIKEKCLEIIMTVSDDNNMRDLLNELEYFGFKPKLFKEMIIEKKIR